jgi:hypothetical protein
VERERKCEIHLPLLCGYSLPMCEHSLFRAGRYGERMVLSILQRHQFNSSVYEIKRGVTNETNQHI